MAFSPAPLGLNPKRIDVLFDELAELTGQRNALDGRIVDIVAEIDGDGVNGLWGNTGCRSIAALVAWKTGVSDRNAQTVVAIAHRAEAFPLLTDGLRQGRLSLDQVGVIAEKAADGSDAHYAELARHATVNQLRTAVKQESPPTPTPEGAPTPSIRKRDNGDHVTYTITLPKLDAAKFDAARDSHLEARIAECTRDRERHSQDDPYAGADPDQPRMSDLPVPMPTTVDAFMSLVDAGWDTDVAARPHGQRTTVVVHLDLDTTADKPAAALHLGPLLTDAERRELLCDATCEVWFEKNGHPIGAGRATRTVGRRLRRALEHRDHGTCVIPGCSSTRGLHAHHIVHWEDGGPTELDNLVLVRLSHESMVRDVCLGVVLSQSCCLMR